MPAKIKTLARRIIDEIFNNANINNPEELVAKMWSYMIQIKNFVGGSNSGRELNLHTAFPDLHYTIEELLAEDDKLVVRCKGQALLLAPFAGYLPPAKNDLHSNYHLAFCRRQNG